jgi:hypothetical protein
MAMQTQTDLFASKLARQLPVVRTRVHSSLDRIGIVDTGWASTTQDALSVVFEETEHLCGCYFGVSDAGLAPSERSTKIGLLRDDYRQPAHVDATHRLAGALRV